jgi:hypothetical protein
MARGIAAWASLDRDAKTLIGTGQAGDRSRGQVMADIFVERLTGQETAAAVPVEVHLVMSDTALFGAMTAATVAADGVADGADNTDGAAAPDPTETPAWIVGHGPIPAAVARDLLDPAHDGPSGNPRVWIRRLYTHPDTGHLVAMESTRRRFDGLLRRMIILRDDTCRTPWCDAPIRHTDHATRHAYGGGTTYVNGSGLCERCNLGKEQEKWKHEATPEALQVTTPTGHTYLAETPPLLRGHPGPTRGQPEHSTLEDHFALTIGIHYPRAS